MSVTYEFFFQILNIILWILIPISIYRFMKKYKRNKALMNNLDRKYNDLEKDNL